MVYPVKLDEQVADIIPQGLAHHGKTFESFNIVTLREQQLVKFNQYCIMVLGCLKYFMEVDLQVPHCSDSL